MKHLGKSPELSRGSSSAWFQWGPGALLMFARRSPFPVLFTASKTLLAEPQGRDAEGCKDTSVGWRGSREMLVKLIGKKKEKANKQ